jgi:hypothetical protein
MMTMWGFLEAMLEYPEVQKKAQRELGMFKSVSVKAWLTRHITTDDVVQDRLPVWEDLVDTPYLRCIMKEVWRASQLPFVL